MKVEWTGYLGHGDDSDDGVSLSGYPGRSFRMLALLWRHPKDIGCVGRPILLREVHQSPLLSSTSFHLCSVVRIIEDLESSISKQDLDRCSDDPIPPRPFALDSYCCTPVGSNVLEEGNSITAFKTSITVFQFDLQGISVRESSLIESEMKTLICGEWILRSSLVGK